MSCYRSRRNGTRKRRSVRGCVVGQDLATMFLVMTKKGDSELPGLTDDQRPRRLGPKRAANIRKLFNLDKKDDVRQFVVRRTIKEAEGKKKGKTKAPKIQRLVTALTLQRKRAIKAGVRNKMQQAKVDKKAYAERLAEYRHELKERRAAEVAKKEEGQEG